MTNEELALKAKSGDSNALLELWGQNRNLAIFFARRRYYRLLARGNTQGADMDDLIQSAFLALVKAVGYYNDEKGFSFSAFWRNCIKSEYNSLLGVRTSKRDALNVCTSLDRTLTVGADADETTLKDTIPDPVDSIGKSDERIYRSQINDVLHRELEMLSSDQQKTLQYRYWQGMTKAKTAGLMGITIGKADELEHTAIHTLRRRMKGAYV